MVCFDARIFFYFFHNFTSPDNIYFIWKFVQHIGWFEYFSMLILYLECRKKIKNNSLRVIKKWYGGFSTCNIFFTILPGQDLLEQNWM